MTCSINKSWWLVNHLPKHKNVDFVYFIISLKMEWPWIKEWIMLIHNPWIVFMDINLILKVYIEKVYIYIFFEKKKKEKIKQTTLKYLINPEVLGKAFEDY